MQFKIKLEDFWLDEDEDIEYGLKKHITHDVVTKITKSIEDKVQKEITEKVSAVIEEKLVSVIDAQLSELIETGMIMKNREQISITDYLKQMFNDSHRWNQPREIMEKIGKRFATELKARYDNIFASKIVDNMKQQGLLKDEVVQILLEGEKADGK